MAIYDFYKYFESVEVDLEYYNKKYNIVYPNYQPSKFTIKNLFSFINNIDIPEDIKIYFDDYIIVDNERPDQIAYKLYEDINLWWLNLLINRISYYDFPVSNDKIYEMAEYLYVNEYKYSKEKYIQILTEINENKRKIKIVKPEHVNIILTQFFSKVYQRTI